MNRWLTFTAGTAILVVILAAALIPIRRGPKIHCIGGMDTYNTRMQVRGIPFGYSMTTGNDSATCISESDAKSYAYHPVQASFQTAAVWFDLMVYGLIIIASSALLDNKKVRT